MKEKIEELLTRGVSEVIDREHLIKKLESGKKLRVKLGIDPTSPNLHIGRAVALLKMRDLQEMGHTIVLIVGDFTGVIGDTSDKESERPMLAAEIVKKNMETYVEQAGKLLDLRKVEVHRNSEWLNKLTYAEIGEQADQFSVAEFIARDNVRRRLDDGKRVSLREMLYPLMQGYDSVAIKSDIELCGTDQRFNVLAGRRLQEHAGQEPQDVLITNLILGTDGRKMSSSWGNTINLTDEPNDMFGKVMSIPDELIVPYFIHCTRVPMDEVKQIEASLKGTANPRDAKVQLAKELVTLYHGTDAAERAEDYFISVFQKKERPDVIPEIKVAKSEWNVADLLVEIKFATSKTEARRLIDQGGITINDASISDDKTILSVPPQGLVVQKGKRHFVKIYI